MSRNTGLTKTQAHNMRQRGFPFALVTPVRLARPTLPVDATFIATPVEAEGLMLYTFATEEGAKAFRALVPEAEVLI